MSHKLWLAAFGLTATLSRHAFAAPANPQDITIDTTGSVIINQIVSTVTVAACAGSSPAIGISGSEAGYGSASGANSGSDLTPALAGTPNSGASAAVLRPVQPPGWSQQPPISQVVPQPSATLHYGSGPADSASAQASAAVVTIPQLNYPAVNAFTASAIASVVCNGNQATITFGNQQAFAQAALSWAFKGPFTLITYSPSCGTGNTDGTHDFILVQDIISNTPSAMSIVVSIQVIDLEHAVGSNTTITVQIGTNNSPSQGNNTSSSTGNQLCLNGTFDQNLDASQGAPITLADATNWAQVIPGVDRSINANVSSVDDFPTLSRRDHEVMLAKRGFGEFLKGIGDKFKSIPLPPISIPSPGQILKSAENLAQDAIAKLDKFATISKDLTKSVDFNQYPTNGPSPFGSAWKVYGNDKVSAYCVGCGADGAFTVAGTVDFSIANGFKSGRVSASGNLNAAVVFGIDGKLGLTVPLPEQTFAQISLGDLVVPGFLKIGPTARVGAGGSLTLDAAGQLQAGAKLKWTNVQATIDVVGTSNSGVQNWKPSIDPVFTANGQVSTTLDAHLTAAIGFTVGVLDNKFSKSVELIDQPGVQVTAGIQGSTSFQNGQFSGGFTGSCKGVALSAKFYNNLFADIAGVKKYTLFNYISDPITRCINIPTRRSIELEGSVFDQEARRVVAVPRKVRRQVSNSTGYGVAVGSAATTSSPSAAQKSTSASSDTNTTFAVMTSDDGNFELHWSPNGNVYAITSNDTDATASDKGDDSDIDTSDRTGLFGTIAGNGNTKPFIVSDSTGRALHAYSNELTSYGVSRLRTHMPDSMPPKALLVGFTGVPDPNGGPDVLAALDTNGTVYYPIMCVYPSCYPKMYLARDAVAGATALQNLPGITGASGLTCTYLPLEGDGDTEGF